MSRWLKEPLLHFFIAGALLFAAAAFFAPEEADVDSRRIEISGDTRAFLRARFERVWQRQPSPAEEQHAVDEWVREEVLYREGMALGLAAGDPVVRQRMGQKMMMLAEAMVPPLPDEDTLRAWYAERADTYRQPLVYSFEQRFYAPRETGPGAAERAEAALEASRGNGTGVPEGDPTLLPASLDSAPASYVESSFGKAFTDALGDLPLGSWQGPVTSTFGAHLVLLRERSGGTPIEFSAARAQVERDWLYEESAATRERFYAELRAQYRIDDTSQPGATAP